MRTVARASPGRALPDRRSARHRRLRIAGAACAAHGGTAGRIPGRAVDRVPGNQLRRVRLSAVPGRADRGDRNAGVAAQPCTADAHRAGCVQYRHRQGLPAGAGSRRAEHGERVAQPAAATTGRYRLRCRTLSRTVPRKGKGRALPGLFRCIVDVIHTRGGSASTARRFHRSVIVGHGCRVGRGPCRRGSGAVGAGPLHRPPGGPPAPGRGGAGGGAGGVLGWEMTMETV
ncbi:hypothetical protein G6F40_014118 [Rhizopus arrhizus]|nr:hypothetical protein G6F40_014118 [Rhizopus arrhizus]